MQSSRRSFIKTTVGGATALLTGVNARAAVKDKQTLTIVHINDVHGRILPTDSAIGYAKTAAFIKHMKQLNPATIALDAGDTFNGTSLVAMDKGECLSDVLKELSLDAHALGNNDFSLSKKRLQELSAKLLYPMLVANIKARKGQFMPPYVILEVDGLKVGVLAVTAYFGFYDAGLPALEDLYFNEIIDTAIDVVNEIRPKVDFLIALNHLGVDNASGIIGSEDFAHSVPGIDLIIDGHSHTALSEGRVVNGVLIAQAGSFSQYIGVVDVLLEKGKLASAKARLVSKADLAELPDDPAAQKAVDKLVTQSKKLLSNVIGSTKVELVGNRNAVRTGETNMGNMFADAVRQEAGSDIAFYWAGGINGDIPAGDITLGDFYNTLTRSEMFTVKKLRGKQIRAMLEDNVAAYPKPVGTFFHVSGMKYSFNPDKPAGARILSVTAGGKSLDESKFYSVAMLVAHAADKNATGEVISHLREAEDIFLDYIKANSPLSPSVEGRVVMVNS